MNKGSLLTKGFSPWLKTHWATEALNGCLLMLLLTSSVCSLAKRSAPPAVPPVSDNGIVYTAPHFPAQSETDHASKLEQAKSTDAYDQRGGYLEAHDARTGEKLWGLWVYRTAYLATLEQDVQDVFIIALAISGDGKLLSITDERGRRFELNLTH